MAAVSPNPSPLAWPGSTCCTAAAIAFSPRFYAQKCSSASPSAWPPRSNPHFWSGPCWYLERQESCPLPPPRNRALGKRFQHWGFGQLELFPPWVTSTGINSKENSAAVFAEWFSHTAKPGSLCSSPSGVSLRLRLILFKKPKISQCLASESGKHWLTSTLPFLLIFSVRPDVTMLIFLGLTMGKN